MNNALVKTILISTFLFSHLTFAAVQLSLNSAVLSNAGMPFITHQGLKPMSSALAMNIQYGPIFQLRTQLSYWLRFNLKFLTSWQPEGEAHITVISPPEYDNQLKRYISMNRIEEIARQAHIQDSQITVLGLGHGQVNLQGQMQDTYFVIVAAPNLFRIRQIIYQEYLRNGGPAMGWNPSDYYPHITVGYTMRDLHIQDGVVKDVLHSLDTRFQLNVTRHFEGRLQP